MTPVVTVCSVARQIVFAIIGKKAVIVQLVLLNENKTEKAFRLQDCAKEIMSCPFSFLALFDPLSPCVDNFYARRGDGKGTIDPNNQKMIFHFEHLRTN